MKKNIKKTIAGVFCIVIVFIVVSVYLYLGRLNDYKRNISLLSEVKIDELVEMDAKDESFVLYVGRETCPGCVEFSKTLYKAVKSSGIKVYYLNTEKKTKEIKEFRKKYNIEFVPSLISFEKGNKYRKIETNTSDLEIKKILESVEK